MIQSLKSIIRAITRMAVVRGPIWTLGGPLLAGSSYLRVQRGFIEEQTFLRKTGKTFPHQMVRYGPFKGLSYPTAESRGSALWPKLLGIYERELHGAFEKLLAGHYETIIDWGCAEGYYLVGLGLRQPSARLYGVDPDPRARQLCIQLAINNGIDPSRIDIREQATLADFNSQLSKSTLIVCDCEGYEMELFSENLPLLTKANLVIECHDHLVADATSHLTARLESTHDVSIISSVKRTVTDLPVDYRTEVTARFSRSQIDRLIDEGRPGIMRWIVAKPRH